MMDILSESVIINQMKIMRQEQLDSLSVHRKGLVENIDKFKITIKEQKENHEERKRRWNEKSAEIDTEWKRLSSMSPEEYLAEFKTKQEQARLKRIEEEEEKKKKEAEEAKKKALEEQKDEEKPLLENMESKQNSEKPKNQETNQETGNPIQAMHQMVSMAGDSPSATNPTKEAETSPQNNEKIDEFSTAASEPPTPTAITSSTEILPEGAEQVAEEVEETKVKSPDETKQAETGEENEKIDETPDEPMETSNEEQK
jgi:hypothetical protein